MLIPLISKFGTMVAIRVKRSTMSVQPEVIKVQSRFGVTTHNTLLKQDRAADKLLIMLPGRAYTCDFPMLYYLRSAAVQQGYDVLSVEYGFQAAHSTFNPPQAPDLVADLNDTVPVSYT